MGRLKSFSFNENMRSVIHSEDKDIVMKITSYFPTWYDVLEEIKWDFIEN